MGRGTGHAGSVRRNRIILGLVFASVVGTAGVAVLLASDEGENEERYAVQWEAIELSPDRSTVTVIASYPVEGFCVKEPDGIDLEVDGSVATVAAWMVGPPPRDGLTCTAECGRVTQAVTLDEPLPAEVNRFQPASGAVVGCMSSPS